MPSAPALAVSGHALPLSRQAVRMFAVYVRTVAASKCVDHASATPRARRADLPRAVEKLFALVDVRPPVATKAMRESSSVISRTWIRAASSVAAAQIARALWYAVTVFRPSGLPDCPFCHGRFSRPPCGGRISPVGRTTAGFGSSFPVRSPLAPPDIFRGWDMHRRYDLWEISRKRAGLLALRMSPGCGALSLGDQFRTRSARRPPARL
jgi:hypothetical protein